MSSGSVKVVFAALLGNIAIASTKFIAALMTGSSAMFSEAIHSLTDTLNQILLLLGLHLSERPADTHHPFGHGKELYFWAFVVAILVFALGGGIAFYEGVHKLTMADHSFKNPYINYVVLGFSIFFEGLSFSVAIKEFNKMRGHTPIFKAIKESKDPAVFAVLLEDTAAMVGLIIAFIGIFLAHMFDFYKADAIASILIGLLLFSSSFIMARKAKSLLIGEAANPKVEEDILDILKAHKDIILINELLTMQVSPHSILVNMSLDFNDELSASQIEQTICDLKKQIKMTSPDIAKIFIEALNPEHT